jgi:hypothetical protein
MKGKDFFLGLCKVCKFLVISLYHFVLAGILWVSETIYHYVKKTLIYLAKRAGRLSIFIRYGFKKKIENPLKVKFPKEIPCAQCSAIAKRDHSNWKFNYQGRVYFSTMWHYRCKNPACGKMWTTEETRNRTATALMRVVNRNK